MLINTTEEAIKLLVERLKDDDEAMSLLSQITSERETPLHEKLPAIKEGFTPGQTNVIYYRDLVSSMKDDLTRLFANVATLEAISAAKWKAQLTSFFEAYPHLEEVLTTPSAKRVSLENCQVTWGFLTLTGDAEIPPVAYMIEGSVIGLLEEKKLLPTGAGAMRTVKEIIELVDTYCALSYDAMLIEYARISEEFWWDPKGNLPHEMMDNLVKIMQDKFDDETIKGFGWIDSLMQKLWEYFRHFQAGGLIVDAINRVRVAGTLSGNVLFDLNRELKGNEYRKALSERHNELDMKVIEWKRLAKKRSAKKRLVKRRLAKKRNYEGSDEQEDYMGAKSKFIKRPR